ncbi:MAG TPA: peptidoglycan recognition family protein, partial [Blastocatellia bacterium]|nr:peptidoglycan recognition family protein [Blastocatellia bacterium]
QRTPIGILYHTSESELVKFVADNNDDLQIRSKGLLGWVKKNKLYNYVIDRFGQVYRIVPDDQAANHAGNSLWSDSKYIYVGLNESFIGVSFETKSEAGEDQLTEAQIVAGRALTAILRSRYNIDDANCVTHGLVSINPDQMVMGFHHDWIRGFPFEAMGLSDKYKVQPSAIKDYGCTYDSEVLGYMGGRPLPGVADAEAEFQRRAAQSNIKVEELRNRTRERYREQIELVRKLRQGGATIDEQAKVEASQHQSESREKGTP